MLLMKLANSSSWSRSERLMRVTNSSRLEQPHSFRLGYACSKEELIGGLNAMTDYLGTL